MDNKKCIVCGKRYSYCPTCTQDKFKPVWMSLYHDSNCKDIWQTLCAESVGHMTAQEAAEKLRTLDLSNMSAFKENVQNHIQRLLTDDLVRSSELVGEESVPKRRRRKKTKVETDSE